MIDSPLLLLVVMAVIAVVPLALRRHRAAKPDGLRVVSRTALSRSAVVAVVGVGERRLLVGAGDQGVHLIADVTGVADLETSGAASGFGGAPGRHDRSTTTTAGDLDLGVALSGATPGGAGAASSTLSGTTLTGGTVVGTPPLLGRMDAVGGIPVGTPLDGDALDALVAGAAPATTTAGPRIGLVDRLRAMTVRTPTQGRPFHVPLRR